MSTSNKRGQVFVEFLLSFIFIFALCVGATRLIQSHWRQIRCSKNLFETTHRELFQNSDENADFDSEATSSTEVAHEIVCNGVRESLRFKKLENYFDETEPL